MQGLTEFDKKKLKPVTRATSPAQDQGKDSSDAAEKDGSVSASDGRTIRPSSAAVAHLRTRFQEQLKEVRLSSRLEGSPACWSVRDIGPHMEQILLRAGRKVQVQKPILGSTPELAGQGTGPSACDAAGQRRCRDGHSDLILDLAPPCAKAVRVLRFDAFGAGACAGAICAASPAAPARGNPSPGGAS